MLSLSKLLNNIRSYVVVVLFSLPFNIASADSSTDYIQTYQGVYDELRSIEDWDLREKREREFIASELARDIKINLKELAKTGSAEAAYLLSIACYSHNCLEDDFFNRDYDDYNEAEREVYWNERYDNRTKNIKEGDYWLKIAHERRYPQASFLYARSKLQVTKTTKEYLDTPENVMGFVAYKLTDEEKVKTKEYTETLRWLSNLEWDGQGKSQFWYSQLFYGRMYEGSDIPEDETAQLYWLERSASNGDTNAINSLIRHYTNARVLRTNQERVNLDTAYAHLLTWFIKFNGSNNLAALEHVNRHLGEFYSKCWVNPDMDLAMDAGFADQITPPKPTLIWGEEVFCKDIDNLVASLNKNTTMKVLEGEGVIWKFDSSSYLRGTKELSVYGDMDGVFTIAFYVYQDGISEKQLDNIYMNLLRDYGEATSHNILNSTRIWELDDGLKITFSPKALEFLYPERYFNLINKLK